VNNGERPPRREGARREGAGAVATVDAEGRPVREPRQRNDRRDRPVKDRGDANAPNYEGRRPARGRVFDRHSGTGRDPTENKKGGAGKSNWGAAGKDELAAVIEAAAEPAAAGEEVEGAVAAEGAAAATEGAAAAEGAETKGKDKAVEPAAPVEEDPDDKLVSFEEYQKQQKAEAAAAKKKFKQPKARSAGEGVKLDPKWANAVPLKKEDDAQPISITIAKKDAKKETKDAQPQVQLAKKAAPKEKTISAADILRFDTSRPRGEGREGGREGGRGGRGGFNREGREGGRGGFGGRGRRDGGEPTGERRPRREGQGSPAQAAPQAAAPKREAKAAPAPAITDAAQFPALGQ
jgi:plasminogen activator inhibitor 1 RNA-binding protein